MREGWTYKKLGEVCETSSGGTPSKNNIEYYEGGTIPWLRSGEVAQGLIYDSELCITESGLNNSSAKLFPVDTVVLAMYGATVGQVGLLKREMATNQAICGIFPNNKLYPLFLLYSLKAKRPLFLKDAVGGAQPNISQSLIKNTTIPVPPLIEQERIVSELDLLSSIIEKKKAQLKEYDQLAQSIFYDMFGDPVTNEKGWEVKKLEELVSENCPISYGIVQPGDGEKSGVPVVRPVDLRDIYTHNVGLKLTTKEISNAYQRTILKGNELLLCVRGTTGIVSLAAKDLLGCNVSRGITPLEFNSSNKRIFMLYQFMAPPIQYVIAELTHGIALKGINMADVRKIHLIQPPLSLQQQFAEKIEAIEKQKEQIKQSITEVETLFNSRMDYYFN